MWREFKEFALKGSVLDLAVGVIIGSAFGKIVSSLVGDIVTPILGLILGKVNLSGLILSVGSAKISYGSFIEAVIDFVVIAFFIFLLVKQANKLKRQPVPADPTEKNCSFCKTLIPLKATRCPNCTSTLS